MGTYLWKGRDVRLDIEGKTAVVTGGSSGLGRASALALGRSGANVVVAGLEPEGLDETVELIRSEGRAAMAVEVDISDSEQVDAMAAGAAELGGADILVNNAGVYPNRPWYEISEQEWDFVFSVNVKGYFLCSKAIRPQMLERGGGSIINISSITFFVGADEFLHYVSSKGAVVGLTRGLARECGPEGIRVNSIAPGAFPTRAYFLPGRDIPKMDRDILNSQAIKRKGDPADIGNAVLFFASELSSFVTGQTLLVDGGWYLH
jgi:3-oxoacyl-[acyl-carrier protein] reductase